MSIATLWREGRPADARGAGMLPAAAERTRGPLHICFVAPHIWPVFSRDREIAVVGGAEVQQSSLARLLAGSGYRVSIVTMDFGQPHRIALDGVTVYKTFRPDQGIPVLRFLHPRLSATWRALREANADIYYLRSSSMLPGIVAEFCRRYRKRSIYAGASDRDFVPENDQIRFARDRWLYARGLRRVDRIVVQNRLQLASCREHYERDAVLIPSCYELPPASEPRRGDCVLWVGSVGPNKRPELALKIAQRLPERRFILVGGPGVDAPRDYFDCLSRVARSLPNVEVTGFLPLAEVERWFDRARVLLNTSDYEGMPNTFLQAWARGVPTVATVDVGAGIYPVFSDVDTGAREIERLFADEAHWQRLSERCLEYFRASHTCTEVLARYSRLFSELA